MTVYRYKAQTKIARIDERHATQYVSGKGDQAVTRQVSLGWWVITEPPNPIAMQAGPDKPAFKVGASVNIILEVSE